MPRVCLSQLGASGLREFFRRAECSAIRIRKMLQGIHPMERPCKPGTVDDAIELCALVEQRAHHGRAAQAANALEIAEQVELLCELLRAEIDAVLASLDRHANSEK